MIWICIALWTALVGFVCYSKGFNIGHQEGQIFQLDKFIDRHKAMTSGVEIGKKGKGI